MAVPVSNNAEGGSNGTTVTTGNSGGASGDAWDLVSIGVGATLTFDNTHVEGTLAYKVVTPSTGTASTLEWSTAIGTQTTLFVRLYLYLTANPITGNLRIIRFMNGAADVGAVVITTAGLLSLRDSAGAIAGNSSAAVALNQWVRLEASVVCNATTGSIEVKLFSIADGATPTETLTKTGRNTGAQLTKVWFGETSAPGAITARTFWMDDPQTNITAYPGPARVTVSMTILGPVRANAAAPAPTVVGTTVASPSSVAAAAAAPAPTVLAATVASPSAVAAVAAVPAPTPVGTSVASPPTVAAVAAVATPMILTQLFVTPATVAALATIPSVDVRGSSHTPSGWGEEPWGEFPWGGMELPFVPGTHPVIGRDEFPGELPPFEHVIIGPNGQADYPSVVGGFSCDEDVGFATLSGTIEAERVRDQPDIYTDGAQWIVIDSSTGAIVAGGDLLTPAIGGGVAGLKADGWAKRLQRRGERLMYAVRGYSSVFVPKNSEPFGPAGKGFYVQGEDKFQVDANGALRWHVSKGTDGWSIGDQQGFVAAFEGLRPGVRRIVGNIHASFDGPNFKLRTATADTPSGGLSGYADIHDFTPGGTDYDFDIDLPIAAPILDIDLYRTTDGATGKDLDITVTGLVLYGIATDDRWSASDTGRDIAGRLGLATDIDESVFDVLPLDGGADGVYSDPLDTACLLSGMFYRVLGIAPGIPVLQMRRQGAVRWEIVDPEFPVEPIPLPRYDSVLVPYTLSNGVAQSVLEVTAESISQPMLPTRRAYGPVPLPEVQVDAAAATLLGQQILRLVYPERFGGRVTFSRVYGDGGFATAHEVHSQDVLGLPLNGGMWVGTKGLHREGGKAEATFDDGVAAVDRLLARKVRQLLMHHPR